jgi:DHA2 family multidrug resistance protein-like MFS transporter
MSSEPRRDPDDGLPVPQRYWSALAVALAITMAVLDTSAVSIALPTIAREFRIEPADAIWIVNAYQLAVVVSLLPLASLGEIIGYARLYKVGLVLFTAASVACATSDTLLGLTLSRVAQGFGAACIMAINAALVRYTYPTRLLGRGVGLNALVVSMSAALGPTFGSAILAVASWQWLFAINIPLGIVTFAIAAYALPRTDRVRRRFDLVAAGLNALAFGLVILGIDVATRSPHLLLGLVAVAAGLVAGAALAWREYGQARPLLPLDLLRIPIFALSIATSVCSFAAQMLAFVSLPFFFEGTLGRSAVDTGLLLAPWPIAVGLVGPLAGSLSDRFPAAILGGIGLVLMAAGLAALAFTPAGAAWFDIAWRMGLCGLGFGLFQAPNNRTMIAAAPRDRSGAAGGMLATARLTGQTLGATMVALFFALAPGRGETLSLSVAAGLACAAALASLLRLASTQSLR